jgi:hypothetical protein
MVESRMAVVPALVERMLREDREFISAYTVSMFSDCSPPEAAVALTRLGYTPAQIGTLAVDRTNSQDRNGPLPVVIGERGSERVFTVMEGRRWTKVPEYLSNGQLTARFFYDRATGEARKAEGWKSPKNYPESPETAAVVRSIIEVHDAEQARRMAA